MGDESYLARNPGFSLKTHLTGAPKALGPIKEGLPHGIWVFWHPSGARWLLGTFWNGARVGLWRDWHQSGALRSEGLFRADRKHGFWRFRHQDGKKAQEGTYLNGAQWGPWVGWHPTGALRYRGQHDQLGRKVGTFWIHDESGTPIRRERWEDGVRVQDERLSPPG